MTGRAQRFRRCGLVTARRLDAPLTWKTAGQELHGQAGDWLVSSQAGGERTVADAQFRRTHEHLTGDVWRRTGEVEAVQVDEPTQVETLEGTVLAQPGNWILRADDGSRWPVADDVFRRSYLPVETEERA